MGTGDYICVTLRGGAPWGFTLEEGEEETYTPFLVSQVEDGGCAILAGMRDGDEVVSINGEPCANLTLLRASALIDTSIESLQLLLKRYHFTPPEDCESEETFYGETASSGEALKTTTLHIFSPKSRSQTPGEVFKSVSPGHELAFQKDDERLQRCFSPGDMVELQVSLSEQTLDDVGCTSLGSARGIDGEFSNREAVQTVHSNTTSQCIPCTVRQPLSQHGVVVSSSSKLGQVEVIMQQPEASGAGRGLSVGGSRVNKSVGSQSEGEEGGGQCEGALGSFTISFEIPSEEAAPGEEQYSDSEGDRDKPNKHRARHARLRRNESLSEKQVKEAKSKCKRIALLLTAAPLNPNNKGVLMFKKHRQRAKKYTLVSYGTGEDEPEYSNSEDEDNEDQKRETQVGKFTFAASSDSESVKPLFTDDPSCKGVVTYHLDKGLLEIERNLKSQAEMEGKGAAMFAQRRQRMDEISAEHDELRRHGLPVEGVKETEKKIMEHSYVQSTMEGHAYMDVNMHQQNQQQYQQYQEQQYYGQQQNYQQQQQYQQYQQQQYEQSHYQQQQMYQQQQEYHEQQQMQHYSSHINGMVQHQANEIQSSFNNRTAKPFTAENMVATPYSSAVSGTNQDAVGQGEQIASRDERISTPAIRTGILLDSKKRNTGKPMFTFKEAPKVSPNPALLNLLNKSDKKLGFESGPEEDYLSLGAEACNFLQSQRIKPKIPPPVAPKPVINPSSPPWSPQIEASNQDMPQCAENSLSTPAVAPAAETAPAPELEPAPAPASESSPPPAPHEAAVNTNKAEQHAWALQEPEPQQQPLQVTSQEANVQMNSSMQIESSHVSTWGAVQTQAQQVSSSTWHQAQVQPEEPPPSQSPPQPPWVTRQPIQNQVQPQPPTNNWTPQSQPSWTQPQEQAQGQRHGQPPWVQPQEQPQAQPPWAQPQEQPQAQPPWVQPQGQPHSQPQVQPPWAQPQEQPQSQPQVQPPWAQPQEQPQSQPQVQPPWAQPQEQPQVQAQVQPPWVHSNEQQHLQQIQPSWGQSQEPMQPQSQNQWTQQSQVDSQQQPPWVQQPQKKSEIQPPWVQQSPPEPQPQPPWAQQPQHQAAQQSWPQSQAPGQPQPPWVLAQSQQQPTANAWAPTQTQAQAQPPWPNAAQPQPQVQPQANLNPWAPVPVQTQSPPSWPQPPQEPGQHHISSWAQEQNPAQHQPPWAQLVPPQPTPQANWQQPTSNTPPQAQMNTWSPVQASPQTPANAWTPQSQQTPVNVSTSAVNTRPAPKPWQPQETAPQNQIPPPPPPRRMHSFTVDQRDSSPVNPMATVLIPKSSPGPAFEMPIVRGKGADMFAKRQSRMEKFVVDSETVEANKASRSTSPVASLPNEWKYTPNVRAPPPRAYNPIQSPSYPPAASKQHVPSSPSIKAKKKDQEKPKPAPKPLNVIDVMKHQPYQLDSSLFIFGPGAEAVKPPAPKPSCSPPNPPTDNQQIRYEQMPPVQQTGPFGAPYPQQAYGMPMQPVMHDGPYQQAQANVYPYQQPPGAPYQQEYNQQYHQPVPQAYHPQVPQPLNPPYQQAMQAAYQPANSPPYLAPPSVPYEPRPTSNYIAPSFPVAARPESTSGGSSVAAPKPKFTANKSSAQVWKPAAAEKE